MGLSHAHHNTDGTGTEVMLISLHVATVSIKCCKTFEREALHHYSTGYSNCNQRRSSQSKCPTCIELVATCKKLERKSLLSMQFTQHVVS